MGHANYGKDLERLVQDAVLKIPGVDVQRLYDTTNGYVGVHQPADYILYKYPYQYYVECKATWENTLHKDYITQLHDLHEKSLVPGVHAGVIAWFIKHDVTVWMRAEDLVEHFQTHKSVNIKEIQDGTMKHRIIQGKKKRVFFDYDFSDFFYER